MTTLSQRHSFSKSLSFYLRSNLLIVKRLFTNLFIDGPIKFPVGDQLASAPVISFSESELWNNDDNKQNWILTAGKVQNLRVASEKLNGLEIPANTIFSFWKHIGKPSAGNGYVMGREIREGCMIPTIAGGLCQLSNALYDAALKANFEIIERHRHTQIVKGSLSENDLDATVKWNYIDLQFKSAYSFKIVIDFTVQNLLVQFRGVTNNTVLYPPANTQFKAVVLNDCYSCGNFDCHRNPAKDFTNESYSITTFILDEKWPEFDEYVKSTAKNIDYFIVPFSFNSTWSINRFTWDVNPDRHKTFSSIAFKRSISIRQLTILMPLCHPHI
ncbi:MAG: hypothetical protein JWP37_2865 [Mucilaginibacter sp.]|nr:hypothetical protein [Mucilaginibacter sp.]